MASLAQASIERCHQQRLYVPADIYHSIPVDQCADDAGRWQRFAEAEALEADLAEAEAERRRRVELRHSERAAALARLDSVDLIADRFPRAEAELEAIAELEAALPAGLEHLPPGFIGLGRLAAWLAPLVAAALADGTGRLAAAWLARLADSLGTYAVCAELAALGSDGHWRARRLLGSRGAAGWRARSIVMLAVALAEADRLRLRPSQCWFARLLSPPGSGPYGVCRHCEQPHIGLRALSHWDRHGNDTLAGDVGYLQALWLAGAVTWHQWRHPLGLERYCQVDEIGRSGFPPSHYQLAGSEPPRSAVERLERAFAVDRARRVLELEPLSRPLGLRRTLAPP